jgi:hypothetical protein
MGHWGVRSYENDDAADAIDAGLERVHGAAYEALMDDRNPLTPEQVQAQLAGPETLAAAIEVLQASAGADRPPEEWDESERLAFAGVVVRHAELGVKVQPQWLARAIEWLVDEPVDWDEAAARRLRRQQEIDLLCECEPGVERCTRQRADS